MSQSLLSRAQARNALLAAATFLILILIMWGPFGPYNGLPFETAFPYMSETSSLLQGFLYSADPLRIYTNVFYQLSYLLGEMLGIGGSYLPYQIVYVALWWARGILVFLVLQRLLPEHPLFAFSVGALTVVHASDLALQWVGQLNQFGFIVWTLLAFYMLVLAFQQSQAMRTVICLVFAVLFQYVSLWSYESQLFIVLLAPFLLLLWKARRWRRLLLVSVPWYVMPAIYIYLTASRYLNARGQTYQESVLRKDWSLVSILNDWLFNISSSLRFWSWGSHVALRSPQDHIAVGLNQTGLFVLASLAVCVVVVGGSFVAMAQRQMRQDEPILTARTSCGTLVAGLGLLTLSFPAYLLLNNSRQLWRTQFLSGIGTALVMASVVSLVCRLIPGPRFRVAGALASLALVSCFGTSTAIRLGAANYRIWELHRRAIVQVLRIAPRLKAGTVVVLVDVPEGGDPFGDQYWYDLSLRLAYPKTDIAGTYFFADGSSGPGSNLKLVLDEWKWDGSGFPPLVREAVFSHTIFIQYDRQGDGQLETGVPKFLVASDEVSKLYNPLSLIEPGIPPPRVLRRFGE